MRRYLIYGLIIVLFAFGLYQSTYANDLSSSQRHLLQKLNEESGGSFRILWNEKTHTPSVLTGRLTQPSPHTPEWIGYTALDRVKVLYGIKHIARTMKPVKVERVKQGTTFVHFQHVLFDIPVFGDVLVVEIDRQGVAHSIQGQFYADLEDKLFGRPMQPAVSRNAAVATAKSFVRNKGLYVGNGEPTLETYYLPQRSGTPLVYVATFPAQQPGEAEWKIVIHSLTGKVIETFHSALKPGAKDQPGAKDHQ